MSCPLSSGADVDAVWRNPSQPSIKDGTAPLSEAVSLNHSDVVEVGFVSCQQLVFII